MLHFFNNFIPNQLIFGTLHRASICGVQSINETVYVNLFLLSYIETILSKPVLVVIKICMLLLKWSFVNYRVVAQFKVKVVWLVVKLVTSIVEVDVTISPSSISLSFVN